MSYFDKLDDYIIDRITQPLSNEIQQNFGFSNFYIAKWLIIFSTFAALCWVGVMALGIKSFGFILLLSTFILCELSLTTIRVKELEQEEKIFINKKGTTMNRMRVTEKKNRKRETFFLLIIGSLSILFFVLAKTPIEKMFF